jgi:hypothetical protein
VQSQDAVPSPRPQQLLAIIHFRRQKVQHLGCSLHDRGPLTTTLTAPASCPATHAPIGLANLINPARGAIAMESCGRAPLGDCFPRGSVLDREYTSSLSGGTPGLTTLFYHSPGIVCPTGWVTVRSIVKDDDGSIVRSSWARDPAVTRDVILFMTTQTGPVTLAEFLMYDDTVFGHALGPRETGNRMLP